MEHSHSNSQDFAQNASQSGIPSPLIPGYSRQQNAQPGSNPPPPNTSYTSSPRPDEHQQQQWSGSYQHAPPQGPGSDGPSEERGLYTPEPIDNNSAPEVVNPLQMTPMTNNTRWSNSNYSQTPTAQNRYSNTPYPEAVDPYQHTARPLYSSSPEVVSTASPTISHTGSPPPAFYSEWDPHQSAGTFVFVPHNHPDLQNNVQATDEKKAEATAMVAPSAPSVTQADESVNGNKKRKGMFCGLPILACVGLLIGFLVICGVGLGAGLGIGLKNKKSSSIISPSPSPAAASASAAAAPYGATVKGSGIATGQIGNTHLLYFQHSSGQIRFVTTQDWNSWSGGGNTNVAAQDAKLPTPIAVDTVGNTLSVFYISHNNSLHQSVSTDNGASWRPGPLNSLNVIAMNSTNVALQSCNYKSSTGIYLWVATGPTTIQQLEWNTATNQWAATETIPANGQASIGCYTWGNDGFEYVMPINTNNQVEILWRDSTIATSTWAKTNAQIAGVLPTTSMGFTNFLFVQLSNDSLAGYPVSWSGADTAIGALDPHLVIPQTPFPGTSFSVSDVGGGTAVFAHTNGTDIVENLYATDQDSWTSTAISVPKS